MKSRVLLFSLFCIIFVSSASFSAEINVGGPAGDYTTIQEAVNAADPGDTINVAAGTFNENVTIDKTITLNGAGRNLAFVTASNPDYDVFKIMAANVIINGFNISGASGTNMAGINLANNSGASNCNISQNEISGSYFGIYIGVTNNYCVFDNNNLHNNSTGIYGNRCSNSTISNNTVQNGITLINESINNLIQNNTVIGSGIILRLSCSNNTIVNNTLANGYGINLNIMGAEYADTANLIYHNNLIGTSSQVTDYNPADNMYYNQGLLEGNYWSNYAGIDDGSGIDKHAIAGDGIGDTLFPHPGANFDSYPYTTRIPVANAGPDQSAQINQSVNFDGSGSSDSDGTIVLYNWDFGDGTTGSGITASNSYSTAGTYTVTLTITDNEGATNSDVCQIVVNRIINVGPGGDFTTIQEAVNTAYPGDIINVAAGTYNENVTINKTLTLTGAGTNQTYVTASNPNDDVFKVTAGNIKIGGFNINGASGTNMAGINLTNSSGASNCNISQNEISENYFGIYIGVTNNNCVFDNNNLHNNSTGIYGNRCSNSTVSNNTVQNGIILINSSTNNMIKSNTVIGSGIILRLSCSNNRIVKNTLYGNGINLNIMWPDYPDIDNLIYHNNLIDTTSQPQITDPNPADNMYYHPGRLEGNYWSNYAGIDDGSGTGKHAIAGDGIGDTLIPHPGANFDSYPYTTSIPVANAGPDQSVHAGLTVNFDGSGSSDLQGTIVSYSWDFGDGTTESGVTASHIYNAAGTYTVTLTVTDNEGATGSDVSQVHVNNNPPLAIAGGNKSGSRIAPVNFDGSASFDTDGTIVSYLWDFGDGASASGAVVNHIYSSLGTFTATLTVTDNNGAATSDYCAVAIPNLPPVANAGPDQTVEYQDMSTYVTFDGSGSTDDGGILSWSYNWNFGDGTTGTGVIITHYYDAPGNYTVTLSVLDNNYVSDTDTCQVKIFQYPIVSQLNVNPASGEAPLSVNFTAVAFDFDGSIVSYEWDFDGNGIYDTTTTNNTVSYIYNTAGNYTAKVKVTDNDGFTAENITYITVIQPNQPPVLDPIGNKSGDENQLLQFTISGSDPDGGAVSYSASNLPSGAVFDTTTGTFTWTPSFSQAGTYNVTFIVSDGFLTDSELIMITINNIPDLPIAAPSNLKAVRNTSTNYVTLTWNDNSGNESGFKIERKISRTWSQIATVGANIKTYVDINGRKGYIYRVRAYNPDGNSPYSNTAKSN
ncbi:MAG: PKD domain-containing protein [bacterium]